MTRILITGAGSVMGQSTFKALDMHAFKQPAQVHFANSDPLCAGFHFPSRQMKLSATPIAPLASDPGYAGWLEDYVARHGIDIVFSGTQHELEKVALFGDRSGICATLSSKVTRLCLDKAVCMEFLDKAGVRTPGSQRLVSFLEGPSFDGPYIAKPNTSSASRGVLRFDRASDVPELPDPEKYIVQERLVGDEFTCSCYADRYSSDLSTFVFRRTLTVDGATGFGEIVQDSAIDRYLKQIVAALRKAGFSFGNLNVQLIYDPRIGPCVFEINGRLSSTEAPKAKFGFNTSAAYFVNIVEKRPYDQLLPARTGRFIRFYDEIYIGA